MNFLENNPFYLLDVMPTDTRATIVAKAEEKSFQLGDDVCSEAQASLLNPSKRLSAEIDWFYGCGEDDISDIRESIECAEWIYNETIDNLTCLSKLNAMLFNFAISDIEDYYYDEDNIEDEDVVDTYLIRSVISDIDEQYSGIDQVTTAGVINACRSKAGLLPASDDEVGRELKRKREQIKHLISDKILSLGEDDYIELVSFLADEYIIACDHSACVIIDDIVNQYELKMQTSIETASNNITNVIARIKRIDNKECIEAKLIGLIKKIEKWGKLVRPLQCKSEASGVEHQISMDIGWKIRNFAMWLYDEREMKEQALTLVDNMKYFFLNIESLYRALLDDKAMLRNMLNQSNEISDKVWERLEPILPDSNSQDNRTFINAVLWIMSTEADWCYLPPHYGDWLREQMRFNQWREKGIWEKVLEVLIDFPDYEWLVTDVCETAGILPYMRMICRSDHLLWKIKLIVCRLADRQKE